MSIYKPFPQSNLIREWDKLIKLKRDDVIKLYDEWKQIDKENKELNSKTFKDRSDKLASISDFLKSNGVEVFKYSSRGFIPKKTGYQSWYKKNVVDVIEKKYPSYYSSIPTAHMGEYHIDGIRVYNNQSPTNLVELYDKISHQYNLKLREVNKADKLLIKSIEYAAKHNIDIDDLPQKEIITTVLEHAKEQYREENVPIGSEVYLKHECYECNSYIVGERRCSCGNRRISIVVEGDILEGFYHYPEAY